jgi:hypothetical protein
MASVGLAYGERKFGQSYAMRALGGLILAGLLAAIWFAADDQRFQPAAHQTLLWASLAMLGTYAVFCVVIGKTTLTINQQGLRRDSAFGSQEIFWSQIRESRYIVRPVNYATHFGLIGALIAAASKGSSKANLKLTLISNENRRLKVTSNFKNAREAVGIIFGKILPPMVMSVNSRLQRGESVAFGPLKLSATTLQWKTQPPILVTDIASAEITGSYLRIKRTGKWLSVVKVASDKVPDVLVFLEVLERLAPQLKPTTIDPLARVRV